MMAFEIGVNFLNFILHLNPYAVKLFVSGDIGVAKQFDSRNTTHIPWAGTHLIDQALDNADGLCALVSACDSATKNFLVTAKF